MSKRSSERIITLALLMVVNNPLAFSQGKKAHGESYEKGRAEAAENIRREVYVIKAWGLSPSNIHPWPTREDIYQAILKAKYKVSVEWVGGCVVDEETSDYADGYNEVSLAGIEAEYGKGILGKVRRQAEAEYETRYGGREREYNRKFGEALRSLPKRNEE